MSEYADKILAMTKEIERLRDALRPFGEIGRRLGWVDMADDDPHLGDHIMDAPADDIAPGAFYCLMVGHFRDAATVPNGDRGSPT
jgi:hypothetical protein